MPDAPAAREQVERELQRRQQPKWRGSSSKYWALLARRRLETLHHGPALELVLDQRVREVVVAPEGGGAVHRAPSWRRVPALRRRLSARGA